MKNKTSFTVREKPQQPTQVNKLVVIVVVLFCAVLISFAFITAFRSPHLASSNHSTLKIKDDDISANVNHLVQDLPSDYTDSSQIKSILKGLNPQKSQIPEKVQKELLLLKQQQNLLEQRLSNLNKEKTSNQSTNLQNRQAEESGLFFPGAAPKSLTDAFKKTTQSSQIKAKDKNDSGHFSSYEQQNMQSQKIQFLKAADTPKEIYNIHSLVKPISPYEIQAGSIIPAVLLTAINTSLPGSVVAQVSEDIYDSVSGGFLLVPKGSRVIGEYDSKVSYGQRRVLIAFTRIIRPDGSSILLSKTIGTDLAGESGIEGNVDNHWLRILGAATLSTILSVGSGVAADHTDSSDNTYYRSAGQNAILGGAANISQVGQQLTDRSINIQPTLTIPSGFEFNIIVQKDMVLAPYQVNSNDT